MIEKHEIYSKHLNRNVTYSLLKSSSSDIYIYLFDGQNLFDINESYMKAIWDVNGALDKTGINANVVGIYSPKDHNRANEYTPYKRGDMKSNDSLLDASYKPLGKQTSKFIVEELISEVEKENPASIRLIGGSSLGGLMSLYMGAKYPDIFARVLAMSSHFNINIFESGEFIGNYDKSNRQKVYLDVGTNEYSDNEVLSQSYVDLNKMVGGFLNDKVDLKFEVIEGGIHHERDWAKRMPEALEFLLKDN